MKSICSNLIWAGLCLACCAHGAAIAADKLPSVPSNLDFEEGARHWRVPRTKWRVEDGAGRGGSKGMVGENYDPHSYSFPGQRIALEGGAVYRFGCWVKGKIRKDGKAILPSVSLDWSDANGKWLSAAYAYPVASNEPNTDGWVRYEGLTSPLPDEAVSGTLLCFMPRGATGKVQFDDYFFKSEDSHPVDWLMSSAYRNTAADGTVTFHANLYINKVKHPLDTLVPQFVYKANDGQTVAVAPDEMSPRAASVAVPVERMAEGPQTVAFTLRNRADGKELGRAECTFTRGTVARRVAFDKHKRTLVDGKPFLPLGMYASVLSDETISNFTNGVFNCIMPYNPKREQLDAAHAAGLKVIYSVKDMVWGSKFVRKGMETREKSLAAIREVVESVKDHPALLAWYVNDEAPERQIGPLREINEMIHALDPDHPTWAVTDKPWHVRPFVGSYDCIGMDPYPIGNNRGGIDIAGGWALEARAGSFDVVPMWHVPQCFNWKWYRGSVTNPEFRFPTREELDSMFWQAIAAGANGLVPYAFHGMRKNLKGADYDKAMGDVKAVMASVKRREAIILSDPGPSATTDAAHLLCRTWTTASGETWLLLSNANRAKVTATVKLGASFRAAVPEPGVTATFTAPAVLSVELAPLASGFVRLQLLSVGLNSCPKKGKIPSSF